MGISHDNLARLRALVADGTFTARFSVEREIGHGGMGRVYAAMQRESGTPIAIKVLDPGLHGDPVRFQEPHTLDLGRANARQHVSLGAGAHFCMGAWLARQQLVAFWSAFAREIEGVALRAPALHQPTVQQNLVLALPLQMTGSRY